MLLALPFAWVAPGRLPVQEPQIILSADQQATTLKVHYNHDVGECISDIKSRKLFSHRIITLQLTGVSNHFDRALGIAIATI